MGDRMPAGVEIIPVQIRSDVTVRIQGIPHDLTPKEAARIAAIVVAMAVAVKDRAAD